MKHLSKITKGMIFSALGFSSFALGDAIFKYLSTNYSTFEILLYSGTFALIAYGMMALKWGGFKKNLQTQKLRLHLIRSAFVTLQVTTIIYAFGQLPLATAYSLVFITPALTGLLAIFILKEHVDRRQWLAITTGFIGVLIILRPGLVPLDWAAGAALLSALGTALANIFVRYLGEDESPLSLALYPQFFILAVMAALALPTAILPPLPDLALMATSGIFSAGGMLALIMGFRNAPAAKAAPFHYIQMLWGVGLGYMIFGDIPDLWTAIGATIIIISGFWLMRHNRKNIPDLGGS